LRQTFLQQLLRTRPLDAPEVIVEGQHGLHRTLGLFALTMIGVGATIGTGIFFTMVEAVPKAGPSVILSFLIAAITAGLTALCYSELSAQFRLPALRTRLLMPASVNSALSLWQPVCCSNTGWQAAPLRSAGRRI
jgi:APA family basic amino acid/polyamine antiporter